MCRTCTSQAHIAPTEASPRALSGQHPSHAPRKRTSRPVDSMCRTRTSQAHIAPTEASSRTLSGQHPSSPAHDVAGSAQRTRTGRSYVAGATPILHRTPRPPEVHRISDRRHHPGRGHRCWRACPADPLPCPTPSESRSLCVPPAPRAYPSPACGTAISTRRSPEFEPDGCRPPSPSTRMSHRSHTKRVPDACVCRRERPPTARSCRPAPSSVMSRRRCSGTYRCRCVF